MTKDIESTDDKLERYVTNMKNFLLEDIGNINNYNDQKGTSWTDQFSVEHLKSELDKFLTQIDKDLVDLRHLKLTRNQAKILGFSLWDDELPDLYLIPNYLVKFIDKGTKVTSISGDTYKFGEINDYDERFGCIAFGITIKK